MFNKRLREMRMNRKLTHQNLADSLNMALRSYPHYEQGTREPSFDMLLRIADALDVSLDYLFGRSDDPNSHRK